MTPIEALDKIEAIIPPGSLNQVKILVFQEAWEGKGYAAIAEAAGYDTDYIKGVAAQLWKSLSQALGEKVTKHNFRGVLIQRFGEGKAEVRTQKSELRSRNSGVEGQLDNGNGHSIAVKTHPNIALTSSPTPPPLHPSTPPPTSHDWGEAPDVSTFYAREAELEQLRHWVLERRCRLAALLGFGGIGKTTLAVRLAAQIQEHFDVIIWRSLRYAPKLEGLLNQLIPVISEQQESDMTIRSLVNWMRRSRCLIILDNCETILQSGKTGHYLSGYEGYGDLFRSVGEAVHKSCVILTSREKPPEIALLEGMDEGVYSLSVQGSPDLAHCILQARQLTGNPAQKQQLCDYYGNSPLALKIVASSIQDLFDGDIGEFLNQGAISFNGIRRLLDQHMQRLTPLEESIMIWLAINQTWTKIATLAHDIAPPETRANLLEAVESLVWRSLIEKQSGRYTLQPVVMEYMTDKLVQQVCAEIGERGRGGAEEAGEAGEAEADASILCTHALLKTTVPDYIRASQIRLIVQPIWAGLQAIFPTQAALGRRLQHLLEQFRSSADSSAYLCRSLSPSLSYGPGNLLNLCVQAGMSLSQFDFSHLTIRHTYLRQSILQGLNVAHSTFVNPAFTQIFGSILNVAYSPDGTLIATADSVGGVYLWGAEDGRLQMSCQGHSYWVWAIAFSSDGTLLATGSEDQTVRLWDVATGRCLHILQPDSGIIWAVAFSPDGRQVAIAAQQSAITIWDVHTQETYTLSGHSDDVHAVTFSPKGGILASGSHDHTIKLWNLATGNCAQTLVGHHNSVYSVAFSLDGDLLASGGQDKTVKLWDLAAGTCVHTLTNHRSIVCSIKFSPDGSSLVSSGEASPIKLWDVASGACIQTLAGHEGWKWGVAFSPDGKTLVSGGVDRKVRLWRLPSGKQIHTLAGYGDYVCGVSWHPTENRLASGSSDGSIHIWNMDTGERLNTLTGHADWVFSVAWSPDGATLASASFDCNVRLWDVRFERCLRVLKGHTSSILSVAWRPDGQILLSGGTDKMGRFWNAKTGVCDRALPEQDGWIFQVNWSPDGSMLATGGTDNSARIWDAQTGHCIRTFGDHGGWVAGIGWSPDGALFATGSFDGLVRIWDTQTWNCIAASEHGAQISAIAFHPTQPLLASGDYDGAVRLWSTETGDCLEVFEGHTKPVFTVAFSPDGRRLASGSEDETICIWRVETGKRLHVLRAERPYEGMNITGVSGLTSAQQESLVRLGAIVP